MNLNNTLAAEFQDHKSKTEVRLIKFSSLGQIDSFEASNKRQSSNDDSNDDKKFSNLSLYQLSDKSKQCNWIKSNQGLQKTQSISEKEKSFTKTITSDHQLVQLKPMTHLKNNDTNLLESESRSPKEPFQVIWRQLSFEVDLKQHDQFIWRLLDRIKATIVAKDQRVKKSPTGSEELRPKFKLTDDRVGAVAVADDKDIRTSYPINRKTIFSNLNGQINSGEISAILGPSGAGKTSLLNAICSQANANYRGQVQLISEGKRRMRVSVIPQKDYLMDKLTVKENLLFASKILNPDKEFDHDSNIMQVARMLNLSHCMNSSTANISGGEYKRVSIAQELLERPDILILDEPTSGLDSLNCKNLIKSLRSLIDASRIGTINPIAIILTIHQPDVEIFHMFDHIYCMARGGRTIYEGQPGKVLQVIREQSGLTDDELPFGSSLQYLNNINPANLLIEIASEFVYGRDPIDRLAEYQLDQFNRLSSSSSSSFIDTSQCVNNWAAHHSPGCGIIIDGQKQLLAECQSVVAKHDIAVDCIAAVATATTLTTSPTPSSLSLKSTNSTTLSTNSSIEIGINGSKASPMEHNSNNNNNSNNNKVVIFNRDKRLNSKVDHKGKFWHQALLLTRRNFTSDIRDPLMTFAAITFHLLIPVVMWVAYSKKIGSVRACPVIHREMEILALASNATMSKLESLQEDFAVGLECSTMFFISSYCFSLRSLSSAALSFPLSMHILVKEARNGWYNVPAYVLAKTVASFPFEVLLPVISVTLIYMVLGMPSAEYEWRLWAIALVMTLISLISTTQGLIFGAASMDSVQSAIFLASSTSLPLVLLSGFTARIKQMPDFMKHLSWLSMYRHSTDAINLIRFGFGICPCDSEMDEYLRTKQSTFIDIPDRVKPLFAFYLINTAPDEQSNDTLASAGGSTLANNMTGVSYDLMLKPEVRIDMLRRLETNELDLFGRMAELLTRSFSYGREITSCESVRSQLLTIVDAPRDDFLPYLYTGMVTIFICMNIILFLVVRVKVANRI